MRSAMPAVLYGRTAEQSIPAWEAPPSAGSSGEPFRSIPLAHRVLSFAMSMVCDAGGALRVNGSS
jgi:hypothetical protein